MLYDKANYLPVENDKIPDAPTYGQRQQVANPRLRCGTAVRQIGSSEITAMHAKDMNHGVHGRYTICTR
jgi:hypothetical protein